MSHAVSGASLTSSTKCQRGPWMKTGWDRPGEAVPTGATGLGHIPGQHPHVSFTLVHGNTVPGEGRGEDRSFKRPVLVGYPTAGGQGRGTGSLGPRLCGLVLCGCGPGLPRGEGQERVCPHILPGGQRARSEHHLLLPKAVRRDRLEGTTPYSIILASGV